ncbi:MAG TPA: 2-dehydropantoate 2-reductase [Anaerolineales bacterium]|nr:2-dehydropantoate 2-reductase [Anaerolineales bacterium]
MNILIYGTGAIGSLVGACLAQAGAQVTFLVRPKSVLAMQENGLQVSGQISPIHIGQPQLATSTQQAFQSPQDLVVLAVKSYDTPAVVADLQQIANLPPLLCLQNGVENENQLTAAFGADNVISGTVTTAVALPQPGQVLVERARGIGLQKNHPMSSEIANLLGRGGVTVRQYANPAAMKWTKLLTNLFGNATCAICDLPAADIFANDSLYRAEIQAARETLKIMRQLKLPVVSLPGFPSRRLALMVRYLPDTWYRSLVTKSVVKGRGNKLPSFQLDLRAGKTRTEVDALNGAVGRAGARLNLPVPINTRLARILSDITSGKIAWESFRYQPEKLAQALWE